MATDPDKRIRDQNRQQAEQYVRSQVQDAQTSAARRTASVEAAGRAARDATARLRAADWPGAQTVDLQKLIPGRHDRPWPVIGYFFARDRPDRWESKEIRAGWLVASFKGERSSGTRADNKEEFFTHVWLLSDGNIYSSDNAVYGYQPDFPRVKGPCDAAEWTTDQLDGIIQGLNGL